MAYDRYERDDGGRDDSRRDRDDYGASGQRDYRAAGELGGYGRDNQREYGQRDGNRQDYGRSAYGQTSSGQRDYGSQRHGQDEQLSRGGERDRFTGGSDYYRGDADRQGQGRDTYRQSRGTFDRQPQSHGRDDDRGFLDRAGDEVRSWFGDDDAERRRERDARDTGGGSSRGGHARDDHYHNWRNQQIAAFDRDYDEYRQENQSKFHTEFSSFRTERQGQRDLLNKVEEHQEVVGSDGSHVGTVDKVRGDRIILTKSDPDAGGHHHSIPSRWLQSADGGKLTLRKTAEEAKAHWRDEERQQTDRGAMFGGDERQQSNAGGQTRSNENGEPTGGTNLNRSFSGTY